MFGMNNKNKEQVARENGIALLNAISTNANTIVSEALNSHDANYQLEMKRTLDNLVASISIAKKKLDIHCECLGKVASE